MAAWYLFHLKELTPSNTDGGFSLVSVHSLQAGAQRVLHVTESSFILCHPAVPFTALGGRSSVHTFRIPNAPGSTLGPKADYFIF
jgi:hypothetical protein